MIRKKILFFVLIACCYHLTIAQKTTAKNFEGNVSSTVAFTFDSTFKPLKWRNIGPFRGGRANAVSGVSGQPNVFYAGYTGGGVWKTDDAGITWRNISDGFFKTGSIGDIAVSESDPNVVFVGSGEHAVRGVMTSFGDGIYKSTDAGKTWKNVGLQKTRHISDVIIHPKNPDINYVGAQGTVHGPNADRGVFKSTDGGLSWKKILSVNDSTGISSLAMDPTNPRILFAASWQHQRLPWTVNSGGRGSGIWKSTDGGETWNKVNNGLPSMMGKIGVSVSKANSNKVYAIVEAEKSKAGLYRSDDAGKTWSLQSTHNDITSRSWYYMEVFADTKNEEVVYVLNAPLMKSIDGGKTFFPVRVGHGDTHDLWINPNDPLNIALADDGGAEISTNGGKSWSTLNNQPTAQFYRVNVDNRFPYWVYGGQQDNTSVMIASRTNGAGITDKDWQPSAGCESAYLAFDPDDPRFVYGGCYQGYIERLDTKTNEGKDIQAYPSLNLAIQPKNMKYRFNWNAPIVTSPHDPKTIYHAANVLLKTSNGGLNWEVISPDLTRNDTAKQGPGGGPLTNEGAGGENYNTIYYVIESPLEKGVIWTGSDCGLVNLTRDGGKTWKNVTPKNLPECLINSIETSPHQKGEAYVSATRYKFNDYASYTYKTTDYGNTWSKINDGVQPDDFIRVIREDKTNKDLLYGGAERAFYISENGGAKWKKAQLNLPVVPITDLILHNNDLVASTAGRAFWILDDVSAIQQGILNYNALKIFTPKISYHFNSAPAIPGLDAGRAVGQNAPEGVILDYSLPQKADTNTLTLEISNAKGKVIRTYTNKKDSTFKPYPGGPPQALILPGEKGFNRFVWDMRTSIVSPDVAGAFVYGDYRGFKMAPGKYKAVLKYKNNSSQTEFEIQHDPNTKIETSSWNEQQTVLERIIGNITEMHMAVNDLRKVKKQVENYNDLLKDKPANKDLLEAGKKLVKKIDGWESNIVESRIKNGQDVINWPSKLNAEFFNLRGLVDSHDPHVTEGIKTRLADLEAQWQKYKQLLNEDVKKKIDEYNTLFKSKNMAALII
jgi:photosystem II stability/assembly factor-like uncharacterized protein